MIPPRMIAPVVFLQLCPTTRVQVVELPLRSRRSSWNSFALSDEQLYVFINLFNSYISNSISYHKHHGYRSHIVSQDKMLHYTFAPGSLKTMRKRNKLISTSPTAIPPSDDQFVDVLVLVFGWLAEWTAVCCVACSRQQSVGATEQQQPSSSEAAQAAAAARQGASALRSRIVEQGAFSPAHRLCYH